jgi:hypothetical protein
MGAPVSSPNRFNAACCPVFRLTHNRTGFGDGTLLLLALRRTRLIYIRLYQVMAADTKSRVEQPERRHTAWP